MPRAATTAELLRSAPGFRSLWLGTVVSFLGDWLTTVAVLTIVDQLGGGPMWVAAIMVSKTLPIFVVTPFAGPLADRVDRRSILIATDLLRVILVLAMIGAYWADDLVLVWLFLTLRTLVAGCFIPARSAAIPDLVEDRQIASAVALMGGTWSVMLAMGAALGGVITQAMGVTGALVVDALTFGVSALILMGLPNLPPSDGTGGDTSFRAGLAYLKGKLYLPATLLLKPALGVSSAMLVLLPVYSGGTYPGYEGPLFLGFLYASRGMGALIGSMGVRRIVGESLRALQLTIVAGYLALSIMYVGLASSPGFYVTIAWICFGMIGSGVVWTFADTLAQYATEREVRGRVFSMEFGLTMAGSSTAFLLTASALENGLTPSGVCLVLAALCLVPMALWAAVLTLAKDRQLVL